MNPAIHWNIVLIILRISSFKIGSFKKCIFSKYVSLDRYIRVCTILPATRLKDCNVVEGTGNSGKVHRDLLKK